MNKLSIDVGLSSWTFLLHDVVVVELYLTVIHLAKVESLTHLPRSVLAVIQYHWKIFCVSLHNRPSLATRITLSRLTLWLGDLCSGSLSFAVSSSRAQVVNRNGQCILQGKLWAGEKPDRCDLRRSLPPNNGTERAEVER